MCGRFLNKLPAAEIAAIFGVAGPLPNYPERYNIAPTDPVLVVRRDSAGQRRLEAMRWGLIPYWAKDRKIGVQCINARSDSLATKPAFREPFRQRRCLIPASGFYEWKTVGTGRSALKQPYAILPDPDPCFAFAGLWDRWTDPATKERVLSCSIVTGPPNTLVAPLHDRMPAILDASQWRLWLGEEAATLEELLALLQPFPPARMRLYAVSPRVNSVKNDDAGLLEPAA
jgi:putative SOS response-associated peptidase YedK